MRGLRSAPARRPHRRGTLTVAAYAALLIAMAPAHAETRAEELEGILRAAPRGDAQARAAWLLRQAQEVRDAKLAFEVMEEVTRRSSREIGAPARLWKVRYWMAIGRGDQATLELQALGEVDENAPWSSEASYWRALLSLEVQSRESGRSSIPPWSVMAQLAAVREGPGEHERARQALGLEGAARRLGLLGPWLWQLLRSDEVALRRSVREAITGSAGALAVAPERVALRQRSRP